MLCGTENAAAEDVMEYTEQHFFGKYRGLVVDSDDPTERGRIKVEVPAVMGEETVWAMPCSPYAGADVGFFAMPDVGTGVWVEFEAGDPSFPIWVGCFWGDGQIPSADSDPTIKFFRTHKVTLRIDDSAGELLIEIDGGSTVKMTAREIELESSTIENKSSSKKTVLTASQFNVNNGALKVI